MSAQELHSTRPGSLGRFFVIALMHIIHEGMIGVFIQVELVRLLMPLQGFLDSLNFGHRGYSVGCPIVDEQRTGYLFQFAGIGIDAGKIGDRGAEFAAATHPEEREPSAHAETHYPDPPRDKGEASQIRDTIEDFLDRPFYIERRFQLSRFLRAGSHSTMVEIGDQSDKTFLGQTPAEISKVLFQPPPFIEDDDGWPGAFRCRAAHVGVHPALATGVKSVKGNNPFRHVATSPFLKIRSRLPALPSATPIPSLFCFFAG